MNFPEYLRSVWSDPQFQQLDEKIRLFFFAAASQVDLVGWWYPHPKLTPMEIDGIDPAAAAAALDPWVQRHPSGYLSLRGYVSVQTGVKGLNPSNGFHKGMIKRLGVHQAREVRAGAAPDTIEGLNSGQGLHPGGLDPAHKESDSPEGATEPHGSPSGGALSTKSQAPSPMCQVQTPTGVSEGGQWATQAQDGETVERPAKVDRPGLDNFELVRQTFALFNAPFKEPAPWVMQPLEKAAARKGWAVVNEAAIKYLSTSPGRSLEGFSKTVGHWMRRSCQHPPDDREWVTRAVDRHFPAFGLKTKGWRCLGCGHFEQRDDLTFLPEHEHDYVDHDTPGIVLGPEGTMLTVPRYQECTKCGHQRAPQVLGVVEGQVAA